MSIFNTDIEALIFIIILIPSLYTINYILNFLLYRSERIPVTQKNKVKFVIRVISIIVIVYILIEGFPSFTQIDPQYTAILTGAISTALAFASSEIFANFTAGILLLIVDPFDIGDVVKIKGYKGIIKSISLTKVVLETFDRVDIDISNSDVLSSKILNYSIHLKDSNNFFRFRKEILAPQSKGYANLNIDLLDNFVDFNEEYRELFKLVNKKQAEIIHAYTFKMRMKYNGFRVKIDKLNNLCNEYKDKFGFVPKFHIVDFSNEIAVKFRILTMEAINLLDYQPEFVKGIYKIVVGKI